MLSEEFDERAKSLAPHYSHFKVSKRLLLTGHSHQAWPDVAREGQLEAFEIAARDVDAKWDEAFARTETLRCYLRAYYDDPDGLYSLSANTHDLVTRWLSSLDLRRRTKVVTTSGEFHSISRQLQRLSEVGLEVVYVDPAPLEGFAERLAKVVDDRTAAVCVSRVYYKTGLIQRELAEVATRCRAAGVPLLIDDYHGTNAVPLSISEEGLEDCFMLIGGYKYLQWGEGNCFLRFPSDCTLRPVLTGWFASFATLDHPQRSLQPVAFDAGDNRFAGATYEPTSQFRAARVVDFFRDRGLTPQVLRRQSQAQTSYLREHFLALDLDPTMITLMHNRPSHDNGGFLAFSSPHARTLRARLLERGIYTDARDESLRAGPAPYTTQAHLDAFLEALRELVVKLPSS